MSPEPVQIEPGPGEADSNLAVGAARSVAAPRAGHRGSGRRHPLVAFVVRRVGAGLLTLLVVSALIFMVVQVLPGNVAQVALGRFATPQRVAALTADLHLNRPLPTRYLEWLGNTITGHFGDSTAALAQGNTVGVWASIRTPLRNSVVLAAITLVLFIPLCLLLGAIAALRAGRGVDRAISMSALTLSSMPEFLIGSLLIVVFFSKLHLLPPVSSIGPGQSPFTHVDALVLPVLTLLGVSVAFGTRLVRATTAEVLREDYVAMARLNGLRERRVIWRFGLRNSLAPSVQVVALMIQYLIGGIIVVENVFNYPGIGNALLQAVQVRDTQEIAVIAMLLASVYIVVNIVADLIVVLLVPKLRTQL